MEEANRIRRAEAQGREHLEAARRRLGGLIKDAKPPGLRDDTEDVEINEKDIIAHRYREAFESVRPLIEDQIFINAVSEDLRSIANSCVKEKNESIAESVIIGAAALQTVGTWSKADNKFRAEINRHLKNTIFGYIVRELHSTAKQGASGGDDGAHRAIRLAHALQTIGLWNKLSGESREEINTLMGNTTFIKSVTESVLSQAKSGVEGSTLFASQATRGAFSIHMTGIWSKVSNKSRLEIRKYLESQKLIDTVAEDIRSGVKEWKNKGNTVRAWHASVDAAALKFFAEYYAHEAEKIRNTQGADAARKSHGGGNLTSILPAKKF